jgi:glycosyltransferase involved in cell wall biosynthesis
MNILFLTLVRINSLDDKGIYTDLLREFRDKGHTIFAVNPIERRNKKATFLITEKGVKILNVKTLNIQKTNVFEKGLATLSIEYKFLNAIKKYFKNQKFDIIIYSTPPITFSGIISYIKHRDNAFSYLLLKDIFPQNAVDMDMIKKNSLIHKYFLKKERKLYELSDMIGCMSQANLDYILKHNSYLLRDKIEVNPNSIEPTLQSISNDEIIKIRNHFKLPINKKIFIYGGNLGKPQGIDFLLEIIEKNKNNDAFFLIIGAGTKYNKIKKWFNDNKPVNAKLISLLPKQDFDNLLLACDVGMIFLHKDFTIPNFPSRLLSYLDNGLPVIAATDLNSDVGKSIIEAECGFWIQSGETEKMLQLINNICSDKLNLLNMKSNSRLHLITKFNVKISYQLIMNAFSDNQSK